MKESYLFMIGMSALFIATLASAIITKSYISTFCAGIIGGQIISSIVYFTITKE